MPLPQELIMAIIWGFNAVLHCYSPGVSYRKCLESDLSQWAIKMFWYPIKFMSRGYGNSFHCWKTHTPVVKASFSDLKPFIIFVVILSIIAIFCWIVTHFDLEDCERISHTYNVVDFRCVCMHLLQFAIMLFSIMDVIRVCYRCLLLTGMVVEMWLIHYIQVLYTFTIAFWFWYVYSFSMTTAQHSS